MLWNNNIRTDSRSVGWDMIIDAYIVNFNAISVTVYLCGEFHWEKNQLTQRQYQT